MSWTFDHDRLERIAKLWDGSIRLTTKDGWFWQAIAWLLFLISFGSLKRDRFLDRAATTIGPIHAYPRSWGANSVEDLLPHECQHTKQCRWFGLGIHPWIGLPFMFIAYCLLPLPIGLAWVRYRLELNAEASSWDYKLRTHQCQPFKVRDNARALASNLWGSLYIYAWPLAMWGCKRKAELVIKSR